MLCYKDKMFCNKGDKNNEKCRQCELWLKAGELKGRCETLTYFFNKEKDKQ